MKFAKTRRAFICGLISAFAACAFAHAETSQEFDVAVYGATPAGICAAVAAADQGAKTVLIEESFSPLGGVFTNGADCVHASTYASLSKTPREFFDRVYAYYCNIYGEDSRLIKSASAGALRGGKFEPSVAEKILRQMLASRSNLKLVQNFELKSAKKAGKRLVSIDGTSGKENMAIAAKAFVDASDCMLLSKASGVEFLPHPPPAKAEKAEVHAVENRAENLSAWLGRKKYVSEYNLILSRVPKNKAPIPKVSPEAFRGLEPAFGYDRRSFVYNSLPNGKLRLCVKFKEQNPLLENAQSAVLTGQKARALALNFLSKLLNGEISLPEERRKMLQSYAPAADEAAARRCKSHANFLPPKIRGGCVISLRDLLTKEGAIKSDSVAVAEILAPVKELGKTQKEPSPKIETLLAEIPLAALTPSSKDPFNLSVPTGISATDNAYCLISNQCLFMNLGAVAGTLAAYTAKNTKGADSPDFPDVGELKKILKSRGTKTDISANAP